VPGLVGSFSVLTSRTTCYLFTVLWTPPNLSERNGDIVAYMINSSSVRCAVDLFGATFSQILFLDLILDVKWLDRLLNAC
jgi:hypothetical protein